MYPRIGAPLPQKPEKGRTSGLSSLRRDTAPELGPHFWTLKPKTTPPLIIYWTPDTPSCFTSFISKNLLYHRPRELLSRRGNGVKELTRTLLYI